MNEAVPGYSPLHVKVREIERDIRRFEAEMKLAETQLRRVRGDDEAAQKLRSRLEKRIAARLRRSRG
jgi:septation ring formation regulator EzrA